MRPRVPDVADKLDPAIRSLHSVDYRNAEQLRDGVVIVGAGNSGAEIALDVHLHTTSYSPGVTPAACLFLSADRSIGEVVPGLVELEVAVPRSRPAVW